MFPAPAAGPRTGRAAEAALRPPPYHATRYLLVCTPGGFEQRFGPEAESAPSGPNTDVIVVGPRIAEMDAER